MRTTLNLDNEVLGAAKAKARMSGGNLGEIISRWALRGMKGKGLEHSKKNPGIPQFVIDDNAPIIPSDRAANLIDEEV